jgi:hypothetical protein
MKNIFLILKQPSLLATTFVASSLLPFQYELIFSTGQPGLERTSIQLCCPIEKIKFGRLKSAPKIEIIFPW